MITLKEFKDSIATLEKVAKAFNVPTFTYKCGPKKQELAFYIGKAKFTRYFAISWYDEGIATCLNDANFTYISLDEMVRIGVGHIMCAADMAMSS